MDSSTKNALFIAGVVLASFIVAFLSVLIGIMVLSSPQEPEETVKIKFYYEENSNESQTFEYKLGQTITIPTADECDFENDGYVLTNWSFEISDNKYTINPGDSISAGEYIFYANWHEENEEPSEDAQNLLTVSFYYNNDFGYVKNVKYEQNERITLPGVENYKKTDYTFACWEDARHVEWRAGEEVTISSNTSFYAIWEKVNPTPVDPTPVDPTPVDPTPVDPTPVDPTPVDPTPVDPTPQEPITHTVILYADEEESEVIFNQSFEEGSTFTFPTIASLDYEKENCTFVGWSSNHNAGDQIIVNSNKTFHALWEEVKPQEPTIYTIYFYLNKSAIDYDPESAITIELEEGESYELPSAASLGFEIENHEFSGWKLVVDGGDTFWHAHDGILVDEDKIFYATWEEVEVTEKCNLVLYNAVNYPDCDVIISIQVNQNETFTFPTFAQLKEMGNNLEDYDERIYEIGNYVCTPHEQTEFERYAPEDSLTIEYDLDIYVVLEIKECKLEFYADETCSDLLFEDYIDAGEELSIPNYYLNNYKVVNWIYESESYEPGETIVVYNNMVFYVDEWEKIIYTVSFYADDTLSDLLDSYEIENEETFVVPTIEDLNYEKQNYEFKYWATDSESFKPADEIYVTENYILYAVWEEIVQFTINLYSDDTLENLLETYTLEQDEIFIFPNINSFQYQKPDYQFVAWITENLSYNPNDQLYVYENSDFYADWININQEQNSYTISLYADSQMSQLIDNYEVGSGETFIFPISSQGDYKVSKWNIGQDWYFPDDDIQINSNISAYATWEEIVWDYNPTSYLLTNFGKLKLEDFDCFENYNDEDPCYVLLDCGDVEAICIRSEIDSIPVVGIFAGVLSMQSPNSFISGLGCGRSTLKYVKFEANSNIKFIAGPAFANSSITSISLPNSLITISGGLLNISAYMCGIFYNCTGIKSIILPSSLKTIGLHAFTGCSNLKSVIMPDSVTEIGDYAFSDCVNLTKVNIGNSVQTIGSFAFAGCSSLTSISIPNSVISIGRDDALSIEYTGQYGHTFEGCTNLTSVSLGNSIGTISGYSFANCTSLKSITLPNSVTKIGWGAFYNSGLTSIILHKFLQNVGTNSFAYCNNLKTITIDCNNLRNGRIGMYILNDIFNHSPIATLIIGKNITNIPDYFCSGMSLANVIISNSVRTIGDAFYGCSLPFITIPSSVKSIGSSAFYNTNATIKLLGRTQWYGYSFGGSTLIRRSDLQWYCEKLGLSTDPNSDRYYARYKISTY